MLFKIDNKSSSSSITIIAPPQISADLLLSLSNNPPFPLSQVSIQILKNFAQCIVVLLRHRLCFLRPYIRSILGRFWSARVRHPLTQFSVILRWLFTIFSVWCDFCVCSLRIERWGEVATGSCLRVTWFTLRCLYCVFHGTYLGVF